jgi:hypothetical protein
MLPVTVTVPVEAMESILRYGLEHIEEDTAKDGWLLIHNEPCADKEEAKQKMLEQLPELFREHGG